MHHDDSKERLNYLLPNLAQSVHDCAVLSKYQNQKALFGEVSRFRNYSVLGKEQGREVIENSERDY